MSRFGWISEAITAFLAGVEIGSETEAVGFESFVPLFGAAVPLLEA